METVLQEGAEDESIRFGSLYRQSRTYQAARVIYQATPVVCTRFMKARPRMSSRLVEAAKNGRQNIVLASMVSQKSMKAELKLLGLARASYEQLLLGFQNHLRRQGLPVWGKEYSQAKAVRRLCYQENKSYSTYRAFLEAPAGVETSVNTLVCLIHQENFLLDQQLRRLEHQFLKPRGFLRQSI
ncbi:MAG: four helix bundle suffix domain-containing protein [Syntrophobacteraceae bacterium]